jgi:hypothetical protein
MLHYLSASAAILDMAGLAGFFCWEERAGTKTEFIRRMEIRNIVYALLCPQGGAYLLSRVGQPPRCSFGGTHTFTE